ncbi:TetR/AcrR family transcriptional regulator [Streptomyces sp. NPDC101118]|uniref:TetR/AcrR family transcriptional regulator n=1 Tax=Streptomyces sp. NPDC101118 TaxID=3366109 RepID=UPI0037F229BD
MTLGTRDRLVRTASRLMQHQGYENAPIKQIVREAEATLGSLYHFFPGGKQELAVAAVQFGNEEFAALLRDGLESETDPAEAVRAVAALLAKALHSSQWADGCPVTATALETLDRLPDIQEACARAFRDWQAIVAERLVAGGIAEADARQLAVTVINTLEGAEVTAQVTRDEAPLHTAGEHLARLIGTYAG